MQQESVVKILLFNEKGRILTLRTGIHRQKLEKSHKPDLPGGIVEVGEPEYVAVLRETKEETGIDLEQDALTLGYAATQVYSDQVDMKSVTKLLYIARLAVTPKVTLSWEHEFYE